MIPTAVRIFVCTERQDMTETVAAIREMAEGEGPHIVLEAAGVPATYNLALELASVMGRVVFMGNIRGDLVVPQGRVSSILRKQLRILGTWNSSLVSQKNEWVAVSDMVMREEIDLVSLISHRIALENLADAFRMMSNREEPYQKVMVLNRGDG